MINFEEELKKFAPSLEIDEAEEKIMNNEMTEIADVIEMLTNQKGAGR